MLSSLLLENWNNQNVKNHLHQESSLSNSSDSILLYMFMSNIFSFSKTTCIFRAFFSFPMSKRVFFLYFNPQECGLRFVNQIMWEFVLKSSSQKNQNILETMVILKCIRYTTVQWIVTQCERGKWKLRYSLYLSQFRDSILPGRI